MKSFNLNTWMETHQEVTTRDGRKVRDLTFHPAAKPNEEVLSGVIEGVIRTWFSTGAFNTYNESELDLGFDSVKKTGYINIYKYGNDSREGRSIYSTQEQALRARNELCLATLKIEWEE
jgi:hypothetical protein